MTPQTTIRASTPWIEGVSLDQDDRSRVRFHPADPDEGIVFVRADEPGEPGVRCVPDNLRSMPRWTALEQNGVWVHHTEHVLAAIALCAIDNVRVEMTSDRLPVTDGGTCAAFVQSLRTAGSVTQAAPRRAYVLKAPVFYLDPENTEGQALDAPPLSGGRYILGLPSELFSVTTVFHWSHMPTLPIGVAEYEASKSEMDDAFVHARSYLVEGEQVGEVLGPVQDQVMQMYPGCPSALALEAARHKVIDFIGDLMGLGCPVIGRFIAFRAGHRIHHALVRQMLTQGNLEGSEHQ